MSAGSGRRDAARSIGPRGARSVDPHAAQSVSPQAARFVSRQAARFTVLGLGEAGSAIAAGLAGTGVAVHAFDPGDVVTPPGVERHRDPRVAVAGAVVVLAVTPAHGARAALTEVLDALGEDAIYADLSTSSPGMKRELAGLAEARGVGFVDVALMAPVPGRGVATPALASGPAVEEFVTTMWPLGMPVESAGHEAGLAATRKLLRSIVMKGVAQLLMEALEAAEAADLGTETWENLVAQLSSIDEALLHRLVNGTAAHAARRVEEMEATIDLLDELNVDPVMTRATAARLRQIADGDPDRTLLPPPPTDARPPDSRPSAEQRTRAEQTRGG